MFVGTIRGPHRAFAVHVVAGRHFIRTRRRGGAVVMEANTYSLRRGTITVANDGRLKDFAINVAEAVARAIQTDAAAGPPARRTPRK